MFIVRFPTISSKTPKPYTNEAKLTNGFVKPPYSTTCRPETLNPEVLKP